MPMGVAVPGAMGFASRYVRRARAQGGMAQVGRDAISEFRAFFGSRAPMHLTGRLLAREHF